MKAEAFDKQFDDGGDIADALDLSKAKWPLLAQRRVNVDFPVWMLNALDKEAGRLGVSRQAVVKVLVAQHFHVAA